jgi:glycosyltransferase involved in cell wall biosynthesis
MSPKVSIFTAVKNGERFLVDTIESVLAQTFKDYEHVIVDGASTDGTVDILKRYPHIRWVSEPDSSAAEGFHKALRMCRGEYLFQCCVSDGFLDRHWFETCVDILDKDPEISMVYGFPQYMSEDGHLGKIAYSEFFDHPPPQKEDFLPFWFSTRFMYPEGNYCVRRKVYTSCFPNANSTEFFDVIHPFLKFVYNFNIRGYLPVFVPFIANYGRVHTNWLSQDNKMIVEVGKTIDMYIRGIDDYKAGIMQCQIQHLYRNGEGNVIREVSEEDLVNYRRLMGHCHRTYPLYFGNSVSPQPHIWNRFKRVMTNISHRLKGFTNG